LEIFNFEKEKQCHLLISHNFLRKFALLARFYFKYIKVAGSVRRRKRHYFSFSGTLEVKNKL